MAGADRILQLKLIGDVSSINKTLKGTQGRLRATAGAAGSWIKAAGIGLAIEGVEALGDALGDAWTGFREGEKAGAQLGVTWKNLGLDAGDLQATIDTISDGAKKLGTDDTEAINAFNKALQNTGGDSAAAMDRLRIAQDLVANGSAPNLSAAMDIIRGAAKGSARVVDKFGLDAETAAGRVKQLGEKVKGAASKAADMDPVGVMFNALNEDLEGIVGSLASGDLEGGLEKFRDMGKEIGEAWGSIDEKATPALDKLSGDQWSAAKEAVGKLQTDLQNLGNDLSQKVAPGMEAVGTAAKPVIDGMLALVGPVQSLIQALMGGVGGGLAFILDSVGGAFEVIGLALQGDFAGSFEALAQTVRDLGSDLDDFFFGIPGTIASALPGLVSAGADMGGSILDGITSGLKGVADAIVAPIREGLNGIISAWNSFQIPAIGPVRFGEGTIFDTGNIGPLGPWDLPDIPLLAKGGIVSSPTLAMIGEGRGPEAVIPLDRMGDMGGGNHYSITINTGVGDPVEIGRQVDLVLTAWERRTGRRRVYA